MRKTTKRIVAMCSALMMAMPMFAGCKKNQDTGRSCIDVYCYDAGYGVQWCEDMLKAFVKEDWVTKKYPGIKYTFFYDKVASTAASKLKAMEKGNPYDLLFSCSLEQKYLSGDYCADLTTDVYNAKIPAENLTYAEKCYDSYNETNKDVDQETGEVRYYTAPWAGGMNGILYNAELLATLTDEIPRTTDELIAVCDSALENSGNKNGKYDKGYSFIHYKNLGYWQYLFPIWWAQYEGAEGYYNFWNGIVKDGDQEIISKKIFEQKGRLESLKMFEKLLDYDTGYITPIGYGKEYMTVQTMYLQGSGLFYVCGDWYDMEMSSMRNDIIKQEGKAYTIKQMRTPIISSIVNKLTYRTESNERMSDEMLSELVKAIDEGKTSFEGVSERDFAYVKAAREVVQSIGPGHQTVVPVYAKESAMAKDFLLFMASDKGNEIYIKATQGASLPFDYDVKEKSPETWASLSELQKDRLSYFNDKSLKVNTLAYGENSPLSRYGGVREFTTSGYWSLLASAEKNVTAQGIYDKTIADWTDGKWASALSKAGLN